MECVNVYFVIGGFALLYIVLLIFAIKGARKLPDDFEFVDDDGNHIYYDRKFIKHKRSIDIPTPTKDNESK